ncbi:hypothetical protein L596_009720 [Steinernema carpocapsae]|uniref:Uncharacterized protein n=1 Tax=Steinernema carpocapsae TaxID=34508 RepID=A0A4U5PGH2_STECR|nr:hypothetical protein L596_009720 [Steinernema carpocapsae]
MDHNDSHNNTFARNQPQNASGILEFSPGQGYGVPNYLSNFRSYQNSMRTPVPSFASTASMGQSRSPQVSPMALPQRPPPSQPFQAHSTPQFGNKGNLRTTDHSNPLVYVDATNPMGFMPSTVPTRPPNPLNLRLPKSKKSSTYTLNIKSYPPRTENFVPIQTLPCPTLKIGSSMAAANVLKPEKAPEIQKAPEEIRNLDKVCIENIVATFNLRTKVDLRKISKLVNTELNEDRQKFASCTLRLKNPKATLRIFHTGKVICAGTRTAEECRKALRRGARKIQKLGYLVKFVEQDFVIQNVVGSVYTGFQIDLDQLASDNPECLYEADLFSGAKLPISLEKEKIKKHLTMHVFRNGKVNIMGGRNAEDVAEAYRKNRGILMRYKPSLFIRQERL